MRLKNFIFIVALFLSCIMLHAQNNYFYKVIDTIIIPDSTMYGATLDIDVNNDSLVDFSLSYTYLQLRDSVRVDDSTLFYEDTLDLASIMFLDDSLAFIIPEIGDEFSDSSFNILAQDSFALLDSNSYWTIGFAQAYNLYFGKKVITNNGISYTGASFNKGLTYFGFMINKTIDGNAGWHYGWVRLEHKDAYLHLYDCFVSKTVNMPIRIDNF